MDLIPIIEESWGWVGINPSRIVAENDFGNLIIEDTGGRFWRLCPEDPSCKVMANSTSELNALQNNPDFIADWDMRPLTASAKEYLGTLPEGHKYCLKIPSILGGHYEVENVGITNLIELISFSGDIGYQCNNIPDGTKVALRVVDQ